MPRIPFWYVAFAGARLAGWLAAEPRHTTRGVAAAAPDQRHEERDGEDGRAARGVGIGAVGGSFFHPVTMARTRLSGPSTLSTTTPAM